MDNSAARRYNKKITTTLKSVNRNDDFAKFFMNYLRSAETKIYQKERKERRIFDESWLVSIQDIIPVLDKLTRNPRELLKKVQFVTDVERAKKVDAESVRHLASHTELIKARNLDGSVIPKKILTSYSDSSLGTYENRFLMTLVDKLYQFILIRYDLIIQRMHTEYVNHLNISSEFEIDDTSFDYDLSFRVHRIRKQDQALYRRTADKDA